jgi:hypothetical protein
MGRPVVFPGVKNQRRVVTDAIRDVSKRRLLVLSFFGANSQKASYFFVLLWSRRMSHAVIQPGDPAYDAMRICRGLNLAALVVATAMLAISSANLLLTSAAAVCFGTSGETTLGAVAGTSDTRPTAAYAFWLPAAALALRALWSGPLLINRLDILWAGIVGGLVLLILMLVADPIVRQSMPRSLPLAVMAFLYAAGLVPLLDSLADQSPPSGMFYAPIAGRYVESGLRLHYYVSLKPWGPILHDTVVEVPSLVYQHAEAGGLLCAALHPGALGMEWYTVSLCE